MIAPVPTTPSGIGPARSRQLPGPCARRRTCGFTLIEIMVVVVIIALIAAGAILSMSFLGGDRELAEEGRRLTELMNYAHEQAGMQTRELGLYCTDRSYRFLVFDARRNLWIDLDDDDALRRRDLPDGLTLRLIVEAREVVLATPADQQKLSAPQSLMPQVMIFSNGDLSSFQLILGREGSERTVTLRSSDSGDVQLDEPREQAT